MRDRDDVPYIVIERDSGGGVGSFILGALLGAGVALLFAPKTGKETQEELKARAQQLREVAEERMRDASRQLEERLDHAREGVQERVTRLKDAVDSGRQAAVEARSDLEDKLERSKAAYRAGIEAAKAAAAAEAGGDGDALESD
ncbi:MAG: YtxH domain-containing protein [Gemmatimonadales bacterium]|jgi:gas vesicle protein|nr:MAG: YtxH domain-containing protein [Gemmatimonadales bacterium]